MKNSWHISVSCDYSELYSWNKIDLLPGNCWQRSSSSVSKVDKARQTTFHCIYHTEDSMIISLELFWHHYQVLSASFMDELALIKYETDQGFILYFWLR